VEFVQNVVCLATGVRGKHIDLRPLGQEIDFAPNLGMYLSVDGKRTIEVEGDVLQVKNSPSRDIQLNHGFLPSAIVVV
jgi:hypothetical protein